MCVCVRVTHYVSVAVNVCVFVSVCGAESQKKRESLAGGLGSIQG